MAQKHFKVAFKTIIAIVFAKKYLIIFQKVNFLWRSTTVNWTLLHPFVENAVQYIKCVLRAEICASSYECFSLKHSMTELINPPHENPRCVKVVLFRLPTVEFVPHSQGFSFWLANDRKSELIVVNCSIFLSIRKHHLIAHCTTIEFLRNLAALQKYTLSCSSIFQIIAYAAYNKY